MSLVSRGGGAGDAGQRVRRGAAAGVGAAVAGGAQAAVARRAPAARPPHAAAQRQTDGQTIHIS